MRGTVRATAHRSSWRVAEVSAGKVVPLCHVCYRIQRIRALKFKASDILWRLPGVWCPGNSVDQRFSNFFQVGTTFISHNVLCTTLLLGLSNSLGLP